jgi:hypothetical protein
VHDLWNSGEPLPELSARHLEMRRLDVRLSCRSVSKRLDQHVQVGILDASIPFETDVPRLSPAGCGEVGDQSEPIICILRAHRLLHDDEDHSGVLPCSPSESEVEDRLVERVHIDRLQRREQLLVGKAGEETVESVLVVRDTVAIVYQPVSTIHRCTVAATSHWIGGHRGRVARDLGWGPPRDAGIVLSSRESDVICKR